MKKSIFLFFAAILCAMSVQGANTMRIYCKQAQSWWKADNAAVGAYYWGTGGNANSWPGTRMTKVSGQTDLWYIDVDIDKYQNIIFTRVNGSGSVSDWGAKTNDLTIGNTKNQYTITQSSGAWDGAKSAGSWGTYKPTSTAALATSAANIFVGGQATLTSSLTSNTSANTIKGTAYAISPEGANVSGNTFTATAEGTYTVTATVTYYPLGCPTLTSTATATTTIVAEVPAEETHDVTVSYLCGSTKVADPTTVNTVGVETPVKVTAPEIAKYAFVNWTLGNDVVTSDALTATSINITTKAGGSDFTLVANYEKAKLTYTVTVPAGTENCYLVGAMNGWDVDNPIEMTKQGENVFTTTLEGVATTDEYKYLSKKGSWDYADVQEANRTWSANDVVTAWKDPLATNVHLAGTMTDWDNNKIEFKKATKEATTASIILNLTAGDYKFKIVDNGSWLGNNATIDKTISGWTFASDKGDCPLKATIAGDYTFTWAISTKKLSVTYPTICTVSATANDAAMGTITGAGDYGKGSTATLTATPNDGYLFVNWTKGGEVVATTQEYSFKVTEAVALVANFEAAPEEVHNVTVSYVCGGNKIADDQTVAAVGETTAKTVEAPAIFGYTFDSWKLGAGVTSTDALTSNSIDINIVAGASDFTLTANYTEIPKVTVYFVNNKKWSKVHAYGWKDGEAQGTPAWPGQDITTNKETEQVADFDVYSYSVVPGSYDNIIFNNNSGTQTETFKWTNGKYYYMGAASNYVGGTEEDVATALGAPVPTYDYYIAGTLAGGWSEKQQGMTKDGDVYKHTFSALAAGTYEFKITAGDWEHQWNYNHLAANYVGVEQGKDGENPNGNIKIVTEEAKNVTITFNPNALYPISIEGLGDGTPIPVFDYYVVGTFNEWANPDPKNGMTLDGTVYKATVSLKSGDNELKVTNGTWAEGTSKGYSALGESYEEVNSADGDNIKITLAAGKDIVVVYNATTGKITFEGLTPYVAPLTYTVTVPAGTEKCYIVGAFAASSWNTFVEMDKVTGENNKFTITITGAKESDGYKYARGEGWEYVEVKASGEGIDNRTWTANDEVAKWADIITYVLMGVNGDWTNGIALTQNPDNADEYVLENQVIIKATDAVKVVTLTNGTATAWCGNVDAYSNATYTGGGNDNIVLEDGIYTFYFKKNDDKIYINQTGYVRNVTNKYGTICLPYASASTTGATFYRVAGKETGKVYLESVDALEAGVPYIFEKTANQIKVVYTGDKETTAGKANGLVGTFTEMEVPNTAYILYNNKFCTNNDPTKPNKINAYRAYLNLDDVEDGVPQQMPGRRYIGMGVQGENEATGFENIVAPEGQVIKAIVNGQLVIIRGGEMYNVQGQVIR